ncbi:MAG: T9SS type A sorting domain-containing protein [Bacteroidales bacterium]|nr:T9SS type A sorting domain-containing protein [Bacteroidales bacterium]MCF8403568.1 T9SS type A sorting domain-containing protein [Bacteroidales bacterium]
MKQILTIIILAHSIWLYSQKWDHIFGTTNYKEAFADVLECYDKGYLVSGWYQQYDGNWIIKTDLNGNLLWDKIITHNEYEVGDGEVEQNKSGEIVFARYLNFPEGGQWPLVVKLDSCGNKLWCRVYIDDEYMHGWFEDVILFDNGDVLALGKLFTTESYNERIFLWYIDSNGNLIWRRSYASKENHPLVLERTGFVIHKFGNDYIINGWCAYPYPGNPGTGYVRPFFIGIDSLFEEKWILPFGINDSIMGDANSIIPLNDSVFMGVGFVWGDNSKQNSLYMFFNDEGEELGYTQITNEDIGPDIQANIPTSIARVNDSLFVASTYFGPEDYGNPFGELIIDTAGNIYNLESRPNTTGISKLIKTYDNKYVIGCTYKHPNNNKDIYLYKINDSLQHDTVYPGSYTYDSLCPFQIQSGTIDITDCLLVTNVGEVPSPKEYYASLNKVQIKAYPNPVNGNQITFELQNTKHHKNISLMCFNVFGKKVYSEMVYPYQGESKVKVENWQVGIYMALVYSGNTVVGLVKFVVR